MTAGSVSWQWYRGTIVATNLTETECVDDTSSNCLIKDATSAVYAPVVDDIDDTLNAVATYTDGFVGEDDAKDVLPAAAMHPVLVDTRNEAPVFPDKDMETEGRQTDDERTVPENTSAGVGIGAVVEADDEDENLTYSLGGADAASFDIDRASGLLMTKAALDKETKDTYTITVTAEDSLNSRSSITVTIMVTNVDETPDLEGDAPAEYPEKGTRAVATFMAVDPEGALIIWTLAGANMDDFTIVNGVLRFKSAPDYEDTDNTDHMYAVTVQASDGGEAATATKEETIVITNVEEPGTVTLSTLQPQVDVDITATLDDPDNETANTITWQWYRGNDPISGATNGGGSMTSTYMPAAGDVGSVLRATAMYDDGEGEDKTARAASFRSVRNAPDTNNAPVFPDQDLTTLDTIETEQTREVAENTPTGTNLGAPIAASDPDVLTYSLGGANAASFSINRATGQLSTKAPLDYEANPSYEVTVTATDPFGASDMSVVAITVTDVNEAPMVTGDASIDHPESIDETTVTALDAAPTVYTASDPDTTADPAADLKWSLSGADAGKFDITIPVGNGATRTLAFKANPDYESPGDSGGNNVYEVTLKVTDSKGNSDEQDVTVKVSNIEEDGVVTLSTLQPRVSFAVTATLADPDNVTAGSVSWQWYRAQTLPTSPLPETECVDDTSNNCFIKDATSAAYTPAMDDVSDTLNAVATYTDGFVGEDEDDEDVAFAEAAHVVLADTRNKAPVFPDQDMETDGEQTDQERSVDENTVAGMSVGLPVVATDSIIDPGTGNPTPEILTYSLGGADATSFDIDRASGRLMTKAALDKETKDTYTVTVTATDPSGLQATVIVTIKVLPVDEPPVIMIGGLAISGMRTVDYTENGTSAVETYMVSGPDAASARWYLEGPDDGAFTISSDGVLAFRSSPDYDMPADADNNNIYMVTVKADDGTYMDTYEVTVTVVADADEVPTTISGMRTVDYAENGTDAVATYTLAGTNAGSATLSLSGADAGDFTINGGMLRFKESPDYEMPADADMDNTYMVTLNADGDTYDVTIMVTDEDEVPTIAGDDTIDYAENGMAPVATYTAMDPEETAISSWSLAGDDADVFDIAGGVLTFKESPDYEMQADADADNTYMVTIHATDATMKTGMKTVMVMVTDVDEVPTIEGDATIDYAENGMGDVATFTAMDPEETAISWALSGIDAGVFDISAAGMLTFKESPDYEMPADADTDNSYMVTVEASDGTNMASHEVAIMVTDVDEVPTIAGDATIDYAENGTGDVATFTAMDPEGTAISWSLAGDDAAAFDITDGALTFMASPDYEMPADADTDNTYMVTLNAAGGTYDVTIMVTDVDEVPTIEGDATIDYAENGTGDVATFTAMDPEETAISWTLEGTDAGVFDISSGGVLTFRSSPDYEMAADANIDNIYMVTVEASDGTNMDILEVAITVTDEDDTTVEQDLFNRYNTDDSGNIDLAEVNTAIDDYFDGQLTLSEVNTVIDLYFQ